MVQPSKSLWHMSGLRDHANDASCGVGAPIGLATNLSGMAVLDGDRLVFDIKENLAHTGFGFFFTDGLASAAVNDSNSGQQVLGLVF